ncbi:hypothetical protein [Eikenella corrodens]|uniref:Uncharacterized protein n=1 Tax=Eikenella corrodens TaxID=539 RepID=A0A3S9SJ88_EIKCO|nr:hypothetical protein [Eikenella corrodens]AZR59550.1 hypothetical protein ELB75_05630 [Eikenella corrodens]
MIHGDVGLEWVWGMVKALGCFLRRWLILLIAVLFAARRCVGINHCFRHTLEQENKTAAQICSGWRRNYTGQGLGLTIWFTVLRAEGLADFHVIAYLMVLSF